MVANVVGALAAYKSAAAKALDLGTEPTGVTGGPSFSSMLKDAARSTIDTLHNSEQMTAKAAVGKADLTEVVNAVTNAETTLQTVVAVRDKVINAYQEILRMPM